jgi:hypothetical protein
MRRGKTRSSAASPVPLSVTSPSTRRWGVRRSGRSGTPPDGYFHRWAISRNRLAAWRFPARPTLRVVGVQSAWPTRIHRIALLSNVFHGLRCSSDAAVTLIGLAVAGILGARVAGTAVVRPALRVAMGAGSRCWSPPSSVKSSMLPVSADSRWPAVRVPIEKHHDFISATESFSFPEHITAHAGRPGKTDSRPVDQPRVIGSRTGIHRHYRPKDGLLVGIAYLHQGLRGALVPNPVSPGSTSPTKNGYSPGRVMLPAGRSLMGWAQP